MSEDENVTEEETERSGSSNLTQSSDSAGAQYQRQHAAPDEGSNRGRQPLPMQELDVARGERDEYEEACSRFLSMRENPRLSPQYARAMIEFQRQKLPHANAAVPPQDFVLSLGVPPILWREGGYLNDLKQIITRLWPQPGQNYDGTPPDAAALQELQQQANTLPNLLSDPGAERYMVQGLFDGPFEMAPHLARMITRLDMPFQAVSCRAGTDLGCAASTILIGDPSLSNMMNVVMAADIASRMEHYVQWAETQGYSRDEPQRALYLLSRETPVAQACKSRHISPVMFQSLSDIVGAPACVLPTSPYVPDRHSEFIALRRPYTPTAGREKPDGIAELSFIAVPTSTLPEHCDESGEFRFPYLLLPCIHTHQVELLEESVDILGLPPLDYGGRGPPQPLKEWIAEDERHYAAMGEVANELYVAHNPFTLDQPGNPQPTREGGEGERQQGAHSEGEEGGVGSREADEAAYRRMVEAEGEVEQEAPFCTLGEPSTITFAHIFHAMRLYLDKRGDSTMSVPKRPVPGGLYICPSQRLSDGRFISPSHFGSWTVPSKGTGELVSGQKSNKRYYSRER